MFNSKHYGYCSALGNDSTFGYTHHLSKERIGVSESLDARYICILVWKTLQSRLVIDSCPTPHHTSDTCSVLQREQNKSTLLCWKFCDRSAPAWARPVATRAGKFVLEPAGTSQVSFQVYVCIQHYAT